MKKITKLRACDQSLLVVTAMMLASSIQLVSRWLGMGFLWIHIFLGIAFFILIGWHLQLHFQWRAWFGKLRRQKSAVNKLLAVFGALTLLTALAATIHMFIAWQHSALGGWHGIIGFVFTILAIIHVVKHAGFYKKK